VASDVTDTTASDRFDGRLDPARRCRGRTGARVALRDGHPVVGRMVQLIYSQQFDHDVAFGTGLASGEYLRARRFRLRFTVPAALVAPIRERTRDDERRSAIRVEREDLLRGERRMRFNVRVVATVLAIGVAAACGKKQPPPAPVPQQSNAGSPAPSATSNPSSSNSGDAAAAEAARNRATLMESIRFAYDEAVLSGSAQETLRSKVAILRSNPAIRIRIEGHADERGSVEYNLALGLRRAHAARDFLAGFGIDGSRIEVETYGEDRPVNMGHDEASWAANRRDEFVIVAGMGSR